MLPTCGFLFFFLLDDEEKRQLKKKSRKPTAGSHDFSRTDLSAVALLSWTDAAAGLVWQMQIVRHLFFFLHRTNVSGCSPSHTHVIVGHLFSSTLYRRHCNNTLTIQPEQHETRHQRSVFRRRMLLGYTTFLQTNNGRSDHYSRLCERSCR